MLTSWLVMACAQAELPPQAEMSLGGVNGFLPYATTAELMAKSRDGPIPVVSCAPDLALTSL